MKEIWKKIKGFESYEVSNMGRVRSWRIQGNCKSKSSSPRILKHGKCRGQHEYINLWYRTKQNTRYVHRLVLEAFVGPRQEGMECRHLDGDPHNNRLDNICWGTHEENEKDKVRHGTICRGESVKHSKLKNGEVWLIKRLLFNGFRCKEIAKMFKVSSGCIGSIKTGKKWRHIIYDGE